MRTVRLSFVYEKGFLVKHRLSAGARVEFRRLHFTPSFKDQPFLMPPELSLFDKNEGGLL